MEREIGIIHMEPILISSVVASFNDDIFRCWKSQMVSTGASLRSIREFLRNQEKIASDHWFESSKFTLSKAVKAAKEMVKQTTMHNNAPPSNFAMPSEPTQPSAPASYSEAVKTSGGNGDATPGCSHWSNNDTHRRSANRSQCNSRSSSVCDPGSQTKTGGSAKNKKGDSKKNKEKKKFDCFSCRGNHPLFYCPRYLHSSLEERKKYVTEEGICPLCLAEKHSLLACKDGMCKHCKDAHNSTLCEVSYANKKKGYPPSKDGKDKKKEPPKDGDDEEW